MRKMREWLKNEMEWERERVVSQPVSTESERASTWEREREL